MMLGADRKIYMETVNSMLRKYAVRKVYGARIYARIYQYIDI